jgi:tetratricopeptide (TPR) repeat protein
MKKLVLSLALVATVTFAFGQKKVVKEAEKGFKSGDLKAALTAIDSALRNPETENDPATSLLKAKIYTKIFTKDTTNTKETLEAGNQALATFGKTFEMAGNSKTSPVGKLIYAQDDASIPENLKPYSVNTLRISSLDKAVERYEANDLEMSYEFFNLAGQMDKTDSSTIFNAGFLANDLGRFEEAKKHFNQLLEIPSYNKLNAYYYLLQILSGEDKNPEAAFDLVKKAKLEYPNDKVLNEAEIQLLIQLDKMEDAMIQIKDALSKDPNNSALLLRSGYLKDMAGDLTGALEDYKKSVEVDPEFYEGNKYTGLLYLDQFKVLQDELNSLSDAEWEKRSPEMGKKMEEIYKLSVPYFSKALQIRPDDTDMMRILFTIYTRLKNTTEANAMNAKLSAILGPNWQEN